MKRMVPPALALVAALSLSAVPAARGDDREAKVKGGGVAAFDEGEELFPFVTGFGVKARVGEEGRARGEFLCSLDAPESGIPPLVIIGDVNNGSVNEDGSVTLEGMAIVEHLETGELLDGPFDFAVILWPGGPGVGRFIYFDYVTGPAGDAETVTEGGIRIQIKEEKKKPREGKKPKKKIKDDDDDDGDD